MVAVACCAASDLDEFRVKREGPFAFARKPTVTRDGDRVTVAFETKAFCDVTVAIEESSVKVPGTQGFQGPSDSASSADKGTGTSAARRSQSPFPRIVRHLASGVLGPDAPAPFTKNAKKQSLVWDGKDDRGIYIDDRNALTVRVSLGLKPRFERTLFWSPAKRTGGHTPIVVPRPEGVYVYQGGVLDHLRLFDHDGVYVRAVYPFPADKVDQVTGLRTHTFPHDGQTLPLKGGFHQATLLTCGSNDNPGSHSGGGAAANALAIRDKTVAFVHNRINWVGTDGTSGGRSLEGPEVGVKARIGYHQSQWRDGVVPPRSAAFSPNGRWLYMTGYGWYNGWFHRGIEWKHVVMRMRTDGDAPPEVFIGSLRKGDIGASDKKFKVPTSVDCDAAGRVYVTDYENDRVQVFAEDRRLLKTIPFKHPAHVAVHQRTGHIYVFSWWFRSQSSKGIPPFMASVTELSSFEKPERLATYPLTLLGRQEYSGWTHVGGRDIRAAVDSWSDPTTVWVCRGGSVQALVPDGGRLKVTRDFTRDARRAVRRVGPPALWRQRLNFNPGDGRLYVA